MGRHRILHLITGLGAGGAETMLCNLLTATDRGRFDPVVVSLMDSGVFGVRLERLGVPVEEGRMQRGRISPGAILRLARILRRHRPHLVQAWMYHANLMATLLGPVAGRPRVVWGLHHTDLAPPRDKASTVAIARVCAQLSDLPAFIVACSNTAFHLHAELGYRREKLVVIPNGFDTDRFRPDPFARVALRRELGIAPDSILIGLVARFDHQKDHRSFLRAARLLLDSWDGSDRLHFVLCGRDVVIGNSQLATWVRESRLEGRVHLLGLRHDMPALNAALDVATSASSRGEAFPMAIGEAMACGVPCVVTDVGDCALLVGESGVVVPPVSAGALCEGWRAVLEWDASLRRRRSLSARERIEKEFSLARITERYQALYERALG